MRQRNIADRTRNPKNHWANIRFFLYHACVIQRLVYWGKQEGERHSERRKKRCNSKQFNGCLTALQTGFVFWLKFSMERLWSLLLGRIQHSYLSPHPQPSLFFCVCLFVFISLAWFLSLFVCLFFFFFCLFVCSQWKVQGITIKTKVVCEVVSQCHFSHRIDAHMVKYFSVFTAGDDT